MSLLTHDEISQIHEASLDLLETIGVKLDHSEVFEKVCAAGAEGDCDGATVRMPRALVAQFHRESAAQHVSRGPTRQLHSGRR